MAQDTLARIFNAAILAHPGHPSQKVHGHAKATHKAMLDRGVDATLML